MKTINVLGLGPSLPHYKPDSNITIGVNDIWKHHKTEYVVCVDVPKRFDKQRLKTIIECRPIEFFTCYPKDWNGLRDISGLRLAPIRGSVGTLTDKKQICFSNNSAFVATVMAYHLGAKLIILHGVDFTGHKDLSEPIIQKRAIGDFVKLFFALDTLGVKLMVGSNDSLLSTKMPIWSPKTNPED